MGALELARAELESFAGRGVLDAPALLDLAEVRWRTGDLPGAGVAASAYLGTDDTGVLALVIAAEAAAGVGHPGDARRLAQEALELIEEAVATGDLASAGLAARGRVAPPGRPDGAAHAPSGEARPGSPEGAVTGATRSDVPSGPEILDALFAGMPQSQVWPMRPHFRVEPTGLLFVTPLQGGRRSAGQVPREVVGGALDDDRQDEYGSDDRPSPSDDSMVAGGPGTGWAEARGEADPGGQDGLASTPGLWGDEAPIEPASDVAATPHPELVEARAALEAGDATVAAERLGELLRRRPDLAGAVLSAMTTGGDASPAGPAGPTPSSVVGDVHAAAPATHPDDPIADAPLGDRSEQERP